jgi:site-specific DNA recombinase
MLRNPAYEGTACFGKTETAPRQRITRPLRLRGGIGSRDSAHHERDCRKFGGVSAKGVFSDLM